MALSEATRMAVVAAMQRQEVELKRAKAAAADAQQALDNANERVDHHSNIIRQMKADLYAS